MNFNLDSIIFVSFLTINLIVGLLASKDVKTIREFAVGDKRFSTGTLAATIISIWVSGEFFFTIVAESYREGLIFMSIMIADFISYLLIGLLLAPRLKEFLGKISIAEAMGELYGNKVRMITALAGIIGVSGVIAIQLQIAGLLFEYVLGIDRLYGTIISGIIITLYSSLGGIKSVTFTDIIQFCTFAIIIPVTAYILLRNMGDSDLITNTLATHPKFDYKAAFSFNNPHIYYYISLFIWLLIPNICPAMFQRIAMARDVKQVRDSFVIASFVGLILAAFVCWIGVLILSHYPDIETDNIMKYVISDYDWGFGFKGLLVAGIMAMIMSTVDSYINSNSILLIYDLNNSLSTKLIKNELYYTRICSIIIGLISISLALRGGNFFELILWTSTFYMPIVTVPFMMSLFGFRSSSKSVLSGMFAGFATVIIWEYFFKTEMWNVGGLIPGILANLFVLFLTHYFFNQPGGWVGIRDNSAILERKEEIKIRYNILCNEIRSFNLLNICKKNSPHSEGIIALLGFFVMISTFSSFNTIVGDIYKQNIVLVDILYITSFCLSSLLISYPLWPSKYKNTFFIGICWNLISIFILICFGFLMILLSNFSEILLMTWMVNIIIVSLIGTWRWSLFSIITGMSIALVYYNGNIDYQQTQEFSSLEFKIIYLLLLISSTLIIFLKPKQEHLEETEAKVGSLESEVTELGYEVSGYRKQVSNLNEKVTHYSERVEDQAKEIERLGATAQRILNNVNHELRLPVGNVMNFAQILSSGIDKMSSEELKMISEEVYTNSTRLSTMILNMLDLAMLSAKKIELKKRTINFSELVEERVKRCRAVYLGDKKIDFRLIIEPELLLVVDANYIRQVVDNIVINSINFSEQGRIEVKVSRDDQFAQITISDEGKGIPSTELYDIFTPFKMGSNTESKAQGRGIGLALCKAAIEAHGGTIKAESNGHSGAKFTALLPVYRL